MTREDLLKSPGYWTAGIQIDLYNCAERFMQANNMNKKMLAEHLGVSKGYVSQLLNGDYDHRVSKFVELSLAFGYVPKIVMTPIEEYIQEDARQGEMWKPREYEGSVIGKCISLSTNMGYSSIKKKSKKGRSVA